MDKFKNSPHRRPSQSGQVMIMGILVVLILALAVFILVDVHNMIRGKIKVNTAESAAALAAASWQAEILNLIGELNLVKSSLAIMEDDSLIPAPAVQLTDEQKRQWSAERRQRYIRLEQIRSRGRTLTEMQSRLAYIGPLIALSAAQQAAKNNGLSANNTALQSHINRLDFELQYSAGDQVNGYFWSQPYLAMLKNIAGQGSAIQPSGSLRSYPEVTGPTGVVLSSRELYRAIGQEDWCYWQLRRIVKNGPESGDWYKIEPPQPSRITESDIYPVLVSAGRNSFGVDEQRHFELAGAKDMFDSGDEAPEVLNWYKYRQEWYPPRDSEGYSEWVKDWTSERNWRGNLKPGYDYEGPVAAAASFIDMPMVTPLASKNSSVRLDKNVALREPGKFRIGKAPQQDSSIRRGVWAKVQGAFDENTPPTSCPIVLPVFSGAVIFPTYRPYYGDLLAADNVLWRFLSWLGSGGDIHSGTADAEFSLMAEALLRLESEEWLKKGYNHSFGGVDLLPPDVLFGDSYKYPESRNGAGYLQQAFIGYDTAVPAEAANGYFEDRANPLPDGSYRCYEGGGSSRYFVKTSDGRIKTNEMVGCDGSIVSEYHYRPGTGGNGSVGGGSAHFGPPRM